MGLFNKILSLLKRKQKNWFSGGLSFEEEEDYLNTYGSKILASKINTTFNSIHKGEPMTTQKGFQFKVGQLAKHPSWDVDRKEVLFIGNEKVFYRWVGSLAGEAADPFSCWDDYVLYTPPKKTIRLYPALIDIGASMSIWRVDWDNLFQNEEEANRHFGCQFFKWPASESLFVDVPVEEK